MLRALLAALTTLSSVLCLVFKIIPRSFVVETFGNDWVLLSLMRREGVSAKMGGGVTNETVLAFDGVEV